MLQVTLQLDSENGRIWVMLAGQRLVSLPSADQEGLKVVLTWLVDSQQISVEEAATVQGVTVRTVAGYQATYAETATAPTWWIGGTSMGGNRQPIRWSRTNRLWCGVSR